VRHRKNSLGEWVWRKVEAAAVLAAIAWIWIWINSPPGERPPRQAPGARPPENDDTPAPNQARRSISGGRLTVVTAP
jgi:predicted MFS family arabinose efflux permease